MFNYYSFLFYLELPLDTETRITLETVVCAEVCTELNLAAYIEVRASEVVANLIPELRFGNECGVFCLVEVWSGNVVFPPEVSKSREVESLYSEEILHAPNNSELQRSVLIFALNSLVESFECERVLEILAVEEVVDTEEPCVVHTKTFINSTVVFNMQTQWSELCVLPEVQTTCNLDVCSAHELVVVSSVPCELMIHEEEGVTPLVGLEHLESGCDLLPVTSKIVHYLQICLCSRIQTIQRCEKKNYLFHNKKNNKTEKTQRKDNEKQVKNIKKTEKKYENKKKEKKEEKMFFVCKNCINFVSRIKFKITETIMEKQKSPNSPMIIRDARQLGHRKMLLLGFQHMFAMFGATVLVPTITGLPVATTLLFAGIGTLIFHLITKLKVPAFLGSSFAFLGGYASVKAMGVDAGMTETLALDYACIGVFFAGLVYFLIAALIKIYGIERIMKFFPPVVTGPIVIAIGLTLSGSAISNCQSDWGIALVAILVVVVCSVWARKIFRIIPILLGVLASYIFAVCLGEVDFSALHDAAWIGLPFSRESTVLAVLDNPDWGFALSSIIAVVPIALATIVEHIGDMCAISSTVGENFLENPGLHRTLTGDGIATSVASLFGAPANTTYGENTGVLNLTKVFDPRVIRIAAVLAILFSFCPKFSMLITLMPAATIGGVSLILYGMIAAVGLRNVSEGKVDFTESRNVIVAALILVLAIGIKYGANDQVSFGSISLSGLAIAAIVGIILNAVLPGKTRINMWNTHDERINFNKDKQ